MPEETREQRLQRPDWLDKWSDYPHGLLAEKQAREIVWYAIQLEAELRKAQEDSARLREAGSSSSQLLHCAPPSIVG